MATPKDLTKTERPTTGWHNEHAANHFDRRGDGKDGTEEFKRGYHQTEAKVAVKGAKGREVTETTIPRSGRAD